MHRVASRARLPRNGRVHGIFSLALAIALAVGATFLFEPNGRDIVGRAYAVDGDTLRMDGRAIRLKGVDAPELHQECRRNGSTYRCGEVARDALASVIGGRSIACRASGRDRYQRILAFCSVDGQDLGSRLVGDGLAVSYGDYRLQETKARLSRAGLWAGEFQAPQEWRRANPR